MPTAIPKWSLTQVLNFVSLSQASTSVFRPMPSRPNLPVTSWGSARVTVSIDPCRRIYPYVFVRGCFSTGSPTCFLLLRACLVTFFGQVKLARWAVKKSTWAHLVGVVRLVTQVDFGQMGGLGSQKSSPYLARWSLRVSRDYTAKSRIDCAILAKIAHLAGEMCPISPVPLLLRGGTVQLPVRPG